ncbi:radical SAM/SPASM domain-containing protein [Candidatus Gottesmanbacteria bacterium]|nr:radical SAM/SPASM domain-containing protein [Candidatus Gottesmanbacteria bacterium]
MNILRKIKNIEEMTPLINRIFDVVARNRFYRMVIYSKINQCTEDIKETKRYNIIIETTNLCNARCVMCPHVIMRRKKGVMSDKIFNRIVERLQEEGIDPPVFILNGFGEPLTDSQVFERIRCLKKIYPKTVAKFYSNFNLANDEIINKVFESGLDEINISFNGFSKESYEEIMGIGYNKTRRNLEKLISEKKRRESKLLIRISMALVMANEGEEKRFIEEWESKVDSVSVNKVHTYGNAINDASGKHKINYNKIPYPCKYIWNTIVFGMSGDISLCCLDYEGKYNFGNIKKMKILDIYYSDKFEEIRKMHLKNDLSKLPICRYCYTPFKNGAEWFISNLY